MKKIIDFIKKDVKEDYITMKELSEGKYKSKYTAKQLFDIKWMFKDASVWMIFLLLALSFFAGYFFASQHYQDLCNNYIIENFLNSTIG